jgi:predicted Zn-dependent protease
MLAFARCAAVSISLLLLAGAAASAQDCGVLPPWTPPAGAPQFSPQQQQWLFQFEMDQFMGGLQTVDDAQLTAELQNVLARLLRHMPPLAPAPRVHLLAEDFTDAETFASGQIFISRAMIRSLHSEDELAAILAHELGHYYAGQPAIQFAVDFDKVLNHQPPAAD